MTALTDAPVPDPVITPDAESRLGQLVAMYDQLHAAHRHAEEQLDAIKAAIKVEVTAAAPGARSIVVQSDDLADPLRVTYSPRKRCNTRRLAAERPDVYAVYQAYQEESPSWSIRTVQR